MLHEHSEKALIVSVSFPHVKGTLPPTIGATLVHAIPALRIAKKHTLTHKTFSTYNRCRAAFLPFYFKSKTISLSFYFKKFYGVFFVASKFCKALIKLWNPGRDLDPPPLPCQITRQLTLPVCYVYFANGSEMFIARHNWLVVHSCDCSYKHIELPNQATCFPKVSVNLGGFFARLQC